MHALHKQTVLSPITALRSLTDKELGHREILWLLMERFQARQRASGVDGRNTKTNNDFQVAVRQKPKQSPPRPLGEESGH